MDTTGLVGGGLETIKSVISSSSAGAGVCAGDEWRVSRGISTVVSFAKIRELSVGVVAFSSDSEGGNWETVVRGLGEGVVGVEVLSSAQSPSSCKTLGGKNCEPVRGGLGRGWRVPIGEGRALMLAVLTLERSFISCSEVGVLCWFSGVYIRRFVSDMGVALSRIVSRVLSWLCEVLVKGREACLPTWLVFVISVVMGRSVRC